MELLVHFGRCYYGNISVKLTSKISKIDVLVSPKKLIQMANVCSMKYSCTTIYLCFCFFLDSVCTDPGKSVFVVNLLNRGPYGPPLRKNQNQGIPIWIHACWLCCRWYYLLVLTNVLFKQSDHLISMYRHLIGLNFLSFL